MLVKFLAPAARSPALVLSATVGPAQAAAQQAVPVTDSSFIQMAGSLAPAAGKAREAGGGEGVQPRRCRDFGKRMAADYSKVNEELKAGAKTSAYPAPVMLRQHQQAYDRFLRMSKSSFDKKYMAEMVTRPWGRGPAVPGAVRARTGGVAQAVGFDACYRHCRSTWPWPRRPRPRSARRSPRRRTEGGRRS